MEVKYHQEYLERLSRWDDITRSKFYVLTKHLNVELEDGVHVVKDSDSVKDLDLDLTHNNKSNK